MVPRAALWNTPAFAYPPRANGPASRNMKSDVTCTPLSRFIVREFEVNSNSSGPPAAVVEKPLAGGDAAVAGVVVVAAVALVVKKEFNPAPVRDPFAKPLSEVP